MSSERAADTVRVWVYADGPTAHLEEAVQRGGGRLVGDPREADAVVWDADAPHELGRRLHGGVGWVQLSSAGIEDWFSAGVVDDSRVWTAAKGVYAPPIAEFVVASILMFSRRLPSALRAREWSPLRPGRLQGSVVGVLGAGRIGEEILRLLGPFHVRTLALTRSGRDVAHAERSLGPGDLEELLRASDYLVLAAPDTPETHRLLDAGRLALLKPEAVIVNVGRGTILETDALVEALRTSRLRGAVLDVTDPEPLPADHPLWGLDGVVVTSHTASTRELGAALFAERVETNVRRYNAHLPLLGLVQPEAGY